MLFTSCASEIYIKKPYGAEKFLVSPNKLIVKHKGCGNVEPDTFRAWLNKDEPDEEEITSFFTYSGDTWVAENISLLPGRYMFTAHANVDFSNSGYCNNKRDTDDQEMFVLSLPSPIKIMPLGDSITLGYNRASVKRYCEIGYRYRLYDRLINAGYNADFVGDEKNPKDPTYELDCESLGYPSNFDRDHEGYIGKHAYDLVDEINDKLNAYQPHVILLHIGTNDIKDKYVVDECIHNPDVVNSPDHCAVWNVMKILDEIDNWERQNNKDIVVFLALIVKAHPSYENIFDPDDSYEEEYNNLVKNYNNYLWYNAGERISSDDDIIIYVDMEGRVTGNGAGLEEDEDYDYDEDIFPRSDSLHPNSSGYNKMAGLWFQHLVNFLPIPE